MAMAMSMAMAIDTTKPKAAFGLVLVRKDVKEKGLGTRQSPQPSEEEGL